MTPPVPLFVELCAGTAALSLALHGGLTARPPVSRMGAKTGYAAPLLRVLGLRPGQRAAHYLWCEPDAGVRLLLEAYRDADLAQAAAAIIRGWADEDPRALWERLRAEGPAKCPPADAREVARLTMLAEWAFRRGIPESGFCGESSTETGKRSSADGAAIAMGLTGSLPATVAPDARQVDPREVARVARLLTANRLINLDPSTWRNTGAGGTTHGGEEFCTAIEPLAASVEGVRSDLDATVCDDARQVDPREVARTLTVWGMCYRQGDPDSGGPVLPGSRFTDSRPEAVAARLFGGLPGTVCDDARRVDPPTLPPGVVVYMDPPYQDTTGYAHDLPRSQVVELAERWAAAGATVAISETVGLSADLTGDWFEVDITGERRGQKRTFSKQQREIVTLNRAPAWRPSVQGSLFALKGNP